jgi:hypothetical protein
MACRSSHVFLSGPARLTAPPAEAGRELPREVLPHLNVSVPDLHGRVVILDKSNTIGRRF